jgi:hypothetical protein
VMLASCLLDTQVSPCCPCRALLAARASAGMVLHVKFVALWPVWKIRRMATLNLSNYCCCVWLCHWDSHLISQHINSQADE